MQRCRDSPDQELFQYLIGARKRETVTSDDVNAYLRQICGRTITAKDMCPCGGAMLSGVTSRDMGAARRGWRCRWVAYQAGGRPLDLSSLI